MNTTIAKSAKISKALKSKGIKSVTVKKDKKAKAPDYNGSAVVSNPVPVAPVNITAKAITNIAMLCKLKVSTWTGNIQDKEMTATACVSNNIDATKRLISLRKRLLKSPELNSVINTAQKIRQYHASVTRPWLPGGIGCLPSKNFVSSKEQFDILITEFNRYTNDFIDSIDEIIKADRVALGSAFDITDYPSADELRPKFKASIEYMPVPSTGDFRVEGLSDTVLNDLQKEIEASFANRMKEGDTALLQRILEGDQPSSNGGDGNGLKQLLKRLTIANAKGDVRFKQNSLDNMVEYSKQVRALNIGDNTVIADICDKLEKTYTVDADTLRENEAALADKATETKQTIAEIENAMAGLM